MQRKGLGAEIFVESGLFKKEPTHSSVGQGRELFPLNSIVVDMTIMLLPHARTSANGGPGGGAENSSSFMIRGGNL